MEEAWRELIQEKLHVTYRYLRAEVRNLQEAEGLVGLGGGQISRSRPSDRSCGMKQSA